MPSLCAFLSSLFQSKDERNALKIDLFVCLFVHQIQTKAKKTLHQNAFNHKAQFFIKQQKLKDMKKFQDFSTSFLCSKFLATFHLCS